MKHLSHKLAIGLLATSISLSSVNANQHLIEMPHVVSFDSKHSVSKIQQSRNNPESIIRTFRDGEAQLEKALLSGTAAQDEVIELTKTYKKLKSKFDKLSKEVQKLKLENAALKLEQEQHKSEKQGIWQSFKNWIFKLDVTKVTTTLITGLVTVLCSLLVIIL